MLAGQPGGRREKGATYSDRVMSRLDAGKTHASLGPKLKPGSPERAQRTLNRLIKRGLKPDDVFVDYGCGTLRVGALLINYLEPDRYIGLDIDQRLLDIGLGLLSAEAIDAKRPTVRVIRSDDLIELSARRPDWIFSNGVVQHVSPDDLPVYFTNIHTLATTATTIGIRVTKLVEKSSRKSNNTWCHSLAEIETAARRAGLSVSNFGSTSDRTGGLLFLQKDEGSSTVDTAVDIGKKLN